MLACAPARAKKAIGAVAASILTAILTAIHHMLKDGTRYQDLGADHFDRRAKGKHVLRLLSRLQNLGVNVHIAPSTA